MAIESVTARISALPDQMTAKELRPLLAAMVDAIQNLAAKNDTLTAKLNADGGVTDTNYATDFASSTAAIVID